jgi:hypothetical protein
MPQRINDCLKRLNAPDKSHGKNESDAASFFLLVDSISVQR